MRIFDALNDVDNVKSTIKYIKQYGGIADCAVCYTVDPKYTDGKEHEMVFTDEYFLDKAKQMAELGADMITIKDMSGLIPPQRVSALNQALQAAHRHPRRFPHPLYAGLRSGIGHGGNRGRSRYRRHQLLVVRRRHGSARIGAGIRILQEARHRSGCRHGGRGQDQRRVEGHPQGARNVGIRRRETAAQPFNPLTDTLPAEIDALFDKCIEYAQAENWEGLLDAAQQIEAYFGFPAPNKLVQQAEIPGGMYSNMVAQLKQLQAEDILPRAMELIPSVRLSAGLPPLVTPTSQIVGAQAVNCAMDEKAGRPMYTNKSSQFVGLVRGEYGHTPVKIDPEFRFKICGVREETPYDTSKYQKQPNPALEDAGGVRLAENEKEELLLELFPLVAKTYLSGVKKAAYAQKVAADPALAADKKQAAQPITGDTVVAPLPGRVIEIKVKVGDKIAVGQEVVVLEAMKMENSITSDFAGVVKQILVSEGDAVQADSILIEVESAKSSSAAAAPRAAVTGKTVAAPLPGRVIEIKVKVGDKVAMGQEIIILEAMKMENSITSDFAGYVKQIFVAEGDSVQADAVLVEIADSMDEVTEAAAAATKRVALTDKTVTAPLPGRVIEIKVKAGDEVKAGQEVMVLEAMKMENSITSDFTGRVAGVLVAEGDSVQSEAPLIVIE